MYLKNMAKSYIFEILGFDDASKKYVVLSGGAFTSWYHHERAKDIDMFFLFNKDDPSFKDKFIAEINKKFGTFFTSETFVNNADYERDNDNILEVHNIVNYTQNRFQFIFTKYNTREELINHFDYVHCTPNYHDGTFYIRRDAFECIRDKKLLVNNKERLAKWREEKFLSRGFKHG